MPGHSHGSVGTTNSSFADCALHIVWLNHDVSVLCVLVNGMLQGVLEGTTTATVNLVNADLLAKNRGLK
jgi:hypothetical protein